MFLSSLRMLQILFSKIEPKKCGLLTIPGRLPQAPSGRKSAAPLLLLIDCVTNVTPFPQKSQTLAFIS